MAHTTTYLKVALPGSEVPADQLATVRVRRASVGQLYGYSRPLRVALIAQ